MQSPSITTSTTTSSAGTTSTSTTTIEITTSTTTLLVTTTSSSTTSSSTSTTSSTSTSTSSSTSTTTLYCHPSLTTSTTVVDCTCINVIDHIFKKIDEYRTLNPGITFRDAITTALTNGLLLDSCDFCCPDCDLYALSSIQPYLMLRESDVNLEGCCENFYGGAEQYLQYYEFFNPPPPPASPLPGLIQPQQGFNLQIKRCCSTNFNNCIDNLTKYFADNQCSYIANTQDPSDNSPFALQVIISEIIRDLGIIEYGSFFGKTQICRLIENMAYYSPNKCFLDELVAFLQLGLVIECDGSKLVAASVATYLQYAEASGRI